MRSFEKLTFGEVREYKQKAIDSYSSEMEFLNKKIRAINEMKKKLKTAEKTLTARMFNNVPKSELKNGTTRGSKMRYLSLGKYHIFWQNGYIRLRGLGGFGSTSLFSITQLREDHEKKLVVDFMGTYGTQELTELYELILERELLLGKFSHIGTYYIREEVPILDLESLEMYKSRELTLEPPRRDYSDGLKLLEMPKHIVKIPLDHKFKDNLLAKSEFIKHSEWIENIHKIDERIQEILERESVNKILIATLI